MTTTETPQVETTQAPPVKTDNPCECSHWWAGITVDGADGSEPTIEDEMTTECDGRLVSRTFAQGHDAKLKSLLIRAGVAGLDVHDGRGTSADAVNMAGRFGWGALVGKGVASGLAKLETKRLRDTAKAEAKTELVEPEPKAEPKPKATRQTKREKGADRAARLTERMAALGGEVQTPSEADQARTARLVQAVKDHATEHYTDGWDIVTEAMDDGEIAEQIADCRTPKGAIAKVAKLVGIKAGQRAEIEATAF